MFAIRFRVLLIGLSLLISLQSYSQKNDSIQFSLLTCAPGTEIYSLFGHTAIRYQNFTQNRDLVFNYGMFSFSTPIFIFRFVKGETDYQLGITEFVPFEAEYMFRGSSVYQQVLNLTQEEKNRLLELLVLNYQPQNRIYRYNYFYDNCTTRARDQIERCINGKVIYQDSVDEKSFRGIVHEFTKGFQWEELGMDLCLGAEADEMIDIRRQMFSPFYMRTFADRAYIEEPDGKVRPLVLKEEVIVNAERDEDEAGFPFSPMTCVIAFLVVNVLFAVLQVLKKKIYWGWDIVLYLSQGIAGCIISFLFFFSVHPTVGSNWMILLFNPIPLLYLPFMVYNDVKRNNDRYHIVNLVYLTFFMLLMPVIPQEFNLTVLPLALGLWCNAMSHTIVCRKLK